jgi:ATP-binding cassette subfamily B protein
MSSTELERDKTVTRAVHRLFWQAMFKKRTMLGLTYLGHLPSLFIFNVLIPLQVAYGVQDIITRRFDKVDHQAMLVLIIMLIGATIFAISTWTNHRVNVDGGAYVQRAVFANYLSKDYDFYSSRHIGALGADAVALRTAYQEYSLMVTFDVPKTVVVIFAGLAVLIYKSPILGLVSAACVFFVLAVNILIAKLRLKYRRAVSQASSQLAGMIGDPLSHGPAVKSFAQEDHELERLSEPLSAWRRAQLKIFDTSIPHSFTRYILLAVTMAILLVVSARLYQHNEISIAIVALVQLYVIRIVNTTIDIGDIIKKYESLMSETYEPMATMLVETTINDAAEPVTLPANVTHMLEFEKVSYAYPEASKDTEAVKDFSLTMQKGEKIGLIGYSGGGKTTITKLLLRFMDVTEGNIRIDSVNIRELRQSDLRSVIAYVPQEPLLFHRSISENIAYAQPEASQKDIEKAAKTAYVDEFVKELPSGYDSMVGERGVKLSGGQRQRVAIARALLKNAPILVLDEATSALDSQSEQYIQKALWELMEDRTALVIAHRLSTIQNMDRIVVMDKGAIVQVGTHHQLLKDKKGIYASLWARQSGGYLLP